MSVRIEDIGEITLDRLYEKLEGVADSAFKASYAAVKRAGETAKTRAGQFASEEYTITKGSFMKNVRMSAKVIGKGGGMIAGFEIRYAGNVLPLLAFKTKYSKRGALTTQVKRKGSAATLNRAFTARAFGSMAVFERVGNERYPLEQKYGPSTAHMLQNEVVTRKMGDEIRKVFEQRLDHEITRVLNGWGGSR